MGNSVSKMINGILVTRDEIVELHSGLVHKTCHKYKLFGSRVGLDYDDLLSIGFIGLVKAFDKFDGEKYDVRFSTYAIPTISGEIQRACRDQNPGVRYPRSVKELSYKIHQEGLSDASIDEISLKLDVPLDKAIDAWKYIRHRNPSSIDMPILNDGDANLTIADMLGKGEDLSQPIVDEFLQSLSERHSKIIEMRLNGKSQTEIASVIGVSQAQISRDLVDIGKHYKMQQQVRLDSKIRSETKKILPKTQRRQSKKDVDVSMGKQRQSNMPLAKQLLREGILSVKEIADKTGTKPATLYVYRSNMKKETERTEMSKEMVETPEREVVSYGEDIQEGVSNIVENNEEEDDAFLANHQENKREKDFSERTASITVEIAENNISLIDFRKRIEALMNMMESIGLNNVAFNLSLTSSIKKH